MKQLHDVQLKILDGLLFSKSAKYSQLKPTIMENSQFVFHLNKLVELGLVKKEKTKYRLTTKGKEYANRIFLKTIKIEPQAKVTTVICALKETAGEQKLLLYKRHKNPFYGCVGFPTEKPRWCEKLAQAAQRGLKEEANLNGTPRLFAIRHYRVFSVHGKLLEDKLMHGFFFKNPSGKLEGSLEGRFFWVKENELVKKLIRPLEEFWEFYQAYRKFKNRVTFEEIDIKTKKF